MKPEDGDWAELGRDSDHDRHATTTQWLPTLRASMLLLTAHPGLLFIPFIPVVVAP